jgi:ribosomal protein S18 acetylase RimI-like enzyme
MNNQSAHHIGYFGLDRVDIRHTLEQLNPPLAYGFMLAFDQGQLVGLFGIEVDAEIDRAWLFGPLIDHPDDWHPLADRLYDAVRSLIPAGIGHQEIFCDALNENVCAFAGRHGLPLISDALIFTLTRGAAAWGTAADFRPEFLESLRALHERLFPNTYYTTEQMVDRQDSHTRLLIAEHGGQLQGYVFGKVDPEAAEGYIDFVGVDEAWRGKGIGRSLLGAVVGWMFSFPEVTTIALTVHADNKAAERLYRSSGFTCERSMRAYRT